MNVSDRRRLLGPLNAEPIKFDLESKAAESQAQDGPNDEIRKIFMKTGLETSANGSAYLEIDGVIIWVSVFGPRPIRGSFIERATFSVECKFLPYLSPPNNEIFNKATNFNNNGRAGLTNSEQMISSYIETALISSILLEKYPKSSIDIHITVLSTEKTNLLNITNWITNCSSLALVDSGIELKDIVTSGHVRMKADLSESLIYDPFESSDNDSVDALVSFMNFHNDDIVGLWLEGDGDLSDDVVKKLISNCNKMSKEIRTSINTFLLDNETNE